jgi:hypothetical protein
MARPKRTHRYSEKKDVILNARVTPHTHDLLSRAAERSGRTLSAETEFQLRRALSDMSSGSTYAILTTIGRSIESLVKFRPGQEVATRPTRDGWLKDAYLFEQALQIVLAAFALFRPPGPVPTLSEQDEQGGRKQGQFTLEATLREMQLVDTTKPFNEQTGHERWLNLLRTELGSLVERPVIWGVPVEEARELRADVAKLLSELIPLSQRAGNLHKEGSELPPDERARLDELHKQLEKIIGLKGSASSAPRS